MTVDESKAGGTRPDGGGGVALRAELVGIAHDLNNVLQSIRSAAEVLKLGIPLDGPPHQAIEMLKRGTDRAAALTARLLELAHPDIAGAPAVPGSGPSREAAGGNGLLDGLAVLVVEDESLVAMHVEDLLGQLGSRILGVVATVEEGVQMASHPELALALLDINLGGTKGFAVAEVLDRRGVPFVLMSGDSAVPPQWRGRPVVQKPFELEQLRRAMLRAVRERPAAGGGRDG